jgi:hypothetical protein
MNTLESIAARRSTRRFKDIPVNRDMWGKVLAASGKEGSRLNKQGLSKRGLASC